MIPKKNPNRQKRIETNISGERKKTETDSNRQKRTETDGLEQTWTDTDRKITHKGDTNSLDRCG